MKKTFFLLIAFVSLSFLMSSCYVHTFVVGNGPRTGVEITKKNNYFIYGLIPGKVSDPQEMAGGAKDFEVTEIHTFLDGFLATITMGIYTPYTTKVKK